ncbi:MAG: LLM class flavin-dependent oxidoreductase [Thermoleophilia bacterium]
MNIGVRLPQYGGDWTTLCTVAQRLDRRGVHALWVNDHLQSPGRIKNEPTFEGFTTLAAVSQLTSSARLGIAVTSASYRPHHLIAKLGTVLDVMSGGRMVLGLGTGSDRAEHAAYGIPFPEPRERTDTVRRALRVVGDMAAHPDGAAGDGLHHAPNRPAALGPGGVPVWLAAHGPVLLRLAAREADGVIAAWVPPQDVAARLAVAAGTAADRAPLRAALYLRSGWWAPRRKLRAWLTAEAAALNTTTDVVRPVAGTARRHREGRLPGAGRLDEYAAVGVTDVILALPSRVPVEAYDALAERLLRTGPGIAGDIRRTGHLRPPQPGAAAGAAAPRGTERRTPPRWRARSWRAR